MHIQVATPGTQGTEGRVFPWQTFIFQVKNGAHFQVPRDFFSINLEAVTADETYEIAVEAKTSELLRSGVVPE